MSSIDVHAHLVPSTLINTLETHGHEFGVSLIENKPGCQFCRFKNGTEIRPFFDRLTNVDKRLVEMDQQGIGREILSMWTDIFGYELPTNEGKRWHRALNDSLKRVCQQHPDRFSWLASGPLGNPADAAIELENSIKDGAVGAIVAAHIAGKNLGECELDEFWSACVELGSPVFIHPAQPIPAPRTRRFALNQVVGYTNDTTLCVGSLISAGVLDKYPKLNLILSHGGGSIPFLIGRFDRMHDVGNNKVTGNVAGKLPSDYLKQFHYDTILHNTSAIRYLRDLVGIEKLLLGSDLPFPPGDPDPLLTLANANFSEKDILAVTEANARSLFNI